MDTALFRSHCPELMIDILYGGLTEHGKQFADRGALDPFLSEALSRPPRRSGEAASPTPSRQWE